MVLMGSIAHAGEVPFHHLQVDFERTIKHKNKVDVIRGTIFFDADKLTVFVKITDPINQIMFLKGNELTIYYPDDKKAFKIITKTLMTLPFFQIFLGAVQEDFGLSQMGYKLVKSEKKGDTLVMIWKPPKALEKFVGKYKVTYKNGRLFSAESTGVKTGKKVQLFFANYFKFKNFSFPGKISKKVLDKDGNIVQLETVTYRNFKIDNPFPNSVADFKVPSDIKIRTVRW